ncbi:THUMP domain-containing protein 1-like [Physella acuta]|uniref:THUMP domain-containing protein 1-like n=1 Tax=Physella acuta TaxID=109671 RepID=UPI0027DB98FA|nr:THUMP domain-containing protein 1-like [Physella acuta]XP_059166108.1 THUMP domain-containing protein 1-like [Physella acuta]XP_059166109.1 THUMP domain-containing protein 1-like [Physella acuta]XP_059166111.1 THUMP domain-containing protein 1-like [Physella acuta]XP_059166112.1 THUMP domain-containing protein 1-like [Physella acuta]
MSSEKKGKKRSKSFYRKSAYGSKRPRPGANILQKGMKGFLVMCNSNESSAVRECYNILNEYADQLYGPSQVMTDSNQVNNNTNQDSNDEDDDDDLEKALKKEVAGLKTETPVQKRFQNVLSNAKNCVFISTTVEDPIKLVTVIMEDIAQHGLKKARYAARILPIVGTCKAHTDDIETTALTVLHPIFCDYPPTSYTVLFKSRNNNGNTCPKTQVIPAVTRAVEKVNSRLTFSWNDYQVAILVEVVCTVCCIGVAPDYIRLRKYNLQELQQGPKIIEKLGPKESSEVHPTGSETKGCPTEAKTQECPTETKTQECPTESKTQECPTEAKTQGCPTESKTQECPTEAKTQGCPTESKTQECPTESRIQKCPTESKSQECPTESKTEECPTESKTEECPTLTKTLECPTESYSNEIPLETSQ